MVTYTFNNREDLESWINSHTDKSEKRYLWDYLENLKERKSLNDLKADITDVWFVRLDGKRNSVTVWEHD